MKTKNKVIGYMLPVMILGLFMLIIYGAYTPHQKAEIQRIVCVKFKAGTSVAEVERHMHEFANLRRQIPAIVGYTGGKVLTQENPAQDFDVIHYLTFRNEEGINEYISHPKHIQFIKSNSPTWDHILELNSAIER
jgi:hypothetical protein